MSKIISAAIFFLVLFFQFSQVTKAAIIFDSPTLQNATISPSIIGEIGIGEIKPVTVSGLTPNQIYYWNEFSGTQDFIYCFRADGSGVIKQDLGPFTQTGVYILEVITATDSSTESLCSPKQELGSLQIQQSFSVVQPGVSISPAVIGQLTVGEIKPVTVSGLTLNQLYYWSEASGLEKFVYCFRADGSGVIKQDLGPFTKAGNYTLDIITATADSQESSGSANCRAQDLSQRQLEQAFTVVAASCTMRTEPTSLLNTTLPSAKFIVNVRDNKAFPFWEMRFICGTQNQKPATLEGSQEIYREMPNNTSGNACEFSTGTHRVATVAVTATGEKKDYCEASYTVTDSSVNGTCTFTTTQPLDIQEENCINGTVPTRWGNPLAPQCKCVAPGSGNEIPTGTSLKKCKDPNDPTFDPSKNIICATSGGDPCTSGGSPGFKTAIGCIPTNPDQLVQAVLKFVIGISGGLAFLLMILGAFQMLTSAGNPETLNAGKDRFTQAIIGLLFVIFSLLLLQIIGVDILGLRELGR